MLDFNPPLNFSIPFNIKRGGFEWRNAVSVCECKIRKNAAELKQEGHGVSEVKDHIIACEEGLQPVKEATFLECFGQSVH